MNSVKERLAYLLDYLKVTPSEFEQKVGWPSGYIKDRNRFDLKTLLMIEEAYPEISVMWLFMGEGSILQAENEAFDEDVFDDDDDEDIKFVPLLPVYAQGGSLNDFVLKVKSDDCEWLPTPFKAADFALTIMGDSMAPEYPSGSIVFIKRINEKAFIEWGKVYVIDTCNGVVVKELHKSASADTLECHSINPDPKYAPFDINMRDVYAVFSVVGTVSMK